MPRGHFAAIVDRIRRRVAARSPRQSGPTDDDRHRPPSGQRIDNAALPRRRPPPRSWQWSVYRLPIDPQTIRNTPLHPLAVICDRSYH